MSWDTFFFGPGDAPLLGCHHPPSAGRDRGAGIVLVHSFGQEYIELHRALRQLALMLADAGFSVLRFDLSGMGDSAGGDGQGDVDRWVDDVGAAIEELRKRSAFERLGLFGVRLGGALAARAAALHGDVEALALWDPVVNGRSYLDELSALHEAMLRYAHVRPDRSPSACEELVGFPLSPATRRSISSLDLLTLSARPAPRVLVVETNEKAPQALHCDHLVSLRADVTHRVLPAPELWEWLEDFGKVRVRTDILQSVVGWLDEVDG